MIGSSTWLWQASIISMEEGYKQPELPALSCRLGQVAPRVGGLSSPQITCRRLGNPSARHRVRKDARAATFAGLDATAAATGLAANVGSVPLLVLSPSRGAVCKAVVLASCFLPAASPFASAPKPQPFSTLSGRCLTAGDSVKPSCRDGIQLGTCLFA